MNSYKNLFLLIWFIVSSFTSCISKKVSTPENHSNEKLKLDIRNNDFSKSARDAVVYLKTLIENPNIPSIKVEIYNFHGGTYELRCSIERTDQLLNFQTNTKAMDGSKESTNRKIRILDFITTLDNLELNSENQIVVAGNYQKIYINTGQEEKLFLTRKALGLLSVLKL